MGNNNVNTARPNKLDTLLCALVVSQQSRHFPFDHKTTAVSDDRGYSLDIEHLECFAVSTVASLAETRQDGREGKCCCPQTGIARALQPEHPVQQFNYGRWLDTKPPWLGLRVVTTDR